VVTSQIDNVWYFAGGAFSGTPAAGLQQTVLLHSTPDSALVEGFLANLSPESVMKEFKPSGKEQALAVRLTGKFKTAFPDGKPGAATPPGDTNAPPAAASSLKEAQTETSVILVGDADMFYDNFCVQDTPTPFGNLRRQLNANLNFAQNAVEQLAGDKNLIGVRSRATLNRPFTVVKRIEAEAEGRYRSKINELVNGRQEASRRLNELQQQKGKDQRFILSPEQQKEIELLQKKEAEIGRELRKVEKDRKRDIDALQNRVKAWNIFAMPLAVATCGILLAVYKRKLTAAK
jgi:ABC-type uncharacterized transport system involved in gliding motility auxiliary subunit